MFAKNIEHFVLIVYNTSRDGFIYPYLRELRNTWAQVFPRHKLLAIDRFLSPQQMCVPEGRDTKNRPSAEFPLDQPALKKPKEEFDNSEPSDTKPQLDIQPQVAEKPQIDIELQVAEKPQIDIKPDSSIGQLLNPLDLFQQLIKTGLVPSPSESSSPSTSPPIKVEVPDEPVIEKVEVLDEPVIEKVEVPDEPFIEDLDLIRKEKAELLQSVFDSSTSGTPVPPTLFHQGIQCSTCGERVHSQKEETYHCHLDWHFRQKRMQKEQLKKGSGSRQCFIKTNAWTGVDDEPSITEQDPKEECTFLEKLINEKVANKVKTVAVDPSVPATGNNSCVVCNEPFVEFFNDEEEE